MRGMMINVDQHQPTTLYQLDKSGRLTLDFHEGQSRAWDSLRRFVLVLAGTQGGKTSFGPWWLYREIFGMYDFPGRGGGDYLAVTSSFDLFKLKMLPEMRTVFEDIMGVARWWAGDRILELKDPKTGKFNGLKKPWGRIILRSANAPAGLESSTAKAAWLDECGQDEWSLETWAAIQRRLSLNRGRVLGTTTIYNEGWTKTELYDRWEAGDEDYDVIQFASVINPSFPMAEFKRVERTLPEWLVNTAYKGLYSKMPGLIYPDFDEATMKVEDFKVPKHWPVVIGLDFGGVNNATIYLAQNIDRKPHRWYLFAEYLEGNMAVKAHVQKAKQRIGDREHVTVTGGTGSEEQWRTEWTNAGLYVSPPEIFDVDLGILSVTALIKDDLFRVFSSCSGILDEFKRYKNKVDPNGVVLDIIENKAKFHYLDGLRYASILITSGTDLQIW